MTGSGALDPGAVGIRDAAEADWPAIFPIFRAVVADGETYAYPDGLGSEAARALWMPGPPTRTVVAVDDAGDADGGILGSATMGPNRPGRGSHVATASFMVDADARGRGVGRALGRHMIDWARAAGYRAVQFNAVVETNTSAVRLWRSLGFVIVGTVPGAFHRPDGSYVGLHVMLLDLT